MYKYLLSFLLVLVFKFTSIAQVNLVPNGGFEEYTVCPSSENPGVPDFLEYIGWKSKLYTPDYFNSCSTNTSVSTPKNFIGYQLPNSGDSYIGLFSYDYSSFNNIDNRELATAKLTQTLVIGVKYYLRMKVAPTLNNYGDVINSFTDKTGFLLSTNETSVVLTNFAHLKADVILTDTLSWIELFTSIIADSNYCFITIGNLYDNANTNVNINFSNNNNNWGYTYIDDVCISADSTFCKNFTQQSPNNVKIRDLNDLKIFPNPVTNNTLYFSETLFNRKMQLVNYNGEIIFAIEKHTGSSLQFPVNLNEGIYTLLIDGFISKRFILLAK